MQNSIKSKRFLLFFFFICLYTLFAIITFKKHGSVLNDLGREVSAINEITNGATAYKDFYWFNGPFGIYSCAFLFKVFGAHLLTLQAYGAILSGLIVVAFCSISNRILSPLYSFIAILSFFSITIIGQGTIFLLPYSFSSISTLFFGLLTVLLMLKYMETNKILFIVLSGISTSIAILGKQNVGVYIFICVTIFLLLTHRKNSIYYILSSLSIASVVYSFWLIKLGFSRFVDCFMPSWLFQFCKQTGWYERLLDRILFKVSGKGEIVEAIQLWIVILSIAFSFFYYFYYLKRQSKMQINLPQKILLLGSYTFAVSLQIVDPHHIHNVLATAIIVITFCLSLVCKKSINNLPIIRKGKHFIEPVMVFFLVTLCTYYGYRRFLFYIEKSFLISSKVGEVYVTRSDYDIMHKIMESINKYTKPNDYVASTIYEVCVFLTGRRLTLRYDDFWRYYALKDKVYLWFSAEFLKSKLLILDPRTVRFNDGKIQQLIRNHFQLIGTIQYPYFPVYVYLKKV